MTLETIHSIDVLLGLGAILLQILCVFTIALLLFRVKENKYLSFVKKNFLAIGFFISLAAVFCSLVFTEVFHWVPCFYCWYDRIYIFSQAVIFAIAWFRKDRNVFWYSLVLSSFGLINAVHHMFIYYLGEGNGPCDASGVSCVQRLMNEFGGYISIPTLALTGFVALLTLLAVVHFYKQEKKEQK